MRWCLLGLLVSACAAPESAWERTRAVCGDDGWGSLLDPTLVSAPPGERLDATIPSVACIDQVLVDLDVDAEGFEARDGVAREAFLEPISPDVGSSGLAFALYAARLLLMHDLGPVKDVEVDSLVQEGLVKRLRDAGGGKRWGVQEALYQVLVDDIDALVPASQALEARVGEGADVRTSWNPQANRLSVYGAGWPGGYASLGIIVHELRHDDGPDHIYIRGRSGDVTASGSFGWEASAEVLVYRGLPADVRDPYEGPMAAWVVGALLRIERFLDEDGELVPSGSGFPFDGSPDDGDGLPRGAHGRR